MAHANNSIVSGKFSGTLGKEIVFRDWDGKTVVAKAPKKERVLQHPNRWKYRKDSCLLRNMHGVL
ncbi:hypothetical protein [Paraflavitalea speifideaquila]|uniref:hypothetical protein n=1 Tax=Paraflavitalea speifideaquila TaxID=3076558 RepID=UPI0028E2EEB6|nr:hypothetical protein [Paraflavitalea speifideiaquila]